MNCKQCDKRELCKEPCEWLKKELKKVETGSQHNTFSNLEVVERMNLVKKMGRKLPRFQDECDQAFSRTNPFS